MNKSIAWNNFATITFAFLLVIGLFCSCSNNSNDINEAKLSSEGESCTKTADCEGDLRCVENTCISDSTTSDGDVEDGDFSDGDYIDGDMIDGDFTEGDVIDADTTDGDDPIDGDATVVPVDDACFQNTNLEPLLENFGGEMNSIKIKDNYLYAATDNGLYVCSVQ